MKIQTEVNYDTCITHKGKHLGVLYEISQHGFHENPEPSLQKSTWCTYILLTGEQHEQFSTLLENAPWNGGITYFRRKQETYVDLPASLREQGKTPEWVKRAELPYYRIGDDFSHIWDSDRDYDLQYMERHIKEVIGYLVEAKTPEQKDQ